MHSSAASITKEQLHRVENVCTAVLNTPLISQRLQPMHRYAVAPVAVQGHHFDHLQ